MASKFTWTDLYWVILNSCTTSRTYWRPRSENNNFRDNSLKSRKDVVSHTPTATTLKSFSETLPPTRESKLPFISNAESSLSNPQTSPNHPKGSKWPATNMLVSKDVPRMKKNLCLWKRPARGKESLKLLWVPGKSGLDKRTQSLQPELKLISNVVTRQ